LILSNNNKLAIWLRAETVESESRTLLTPEDAANLIEQGYQITVERSPWRIFEDRAYKKAGCELAPAGTWATAPKDTIILGVGNLPIDSFSLKHEHLFFGNLFNGQKETDETLKRFIRGGGSLLDFRSLCDNSGKAIVSSAYWAGFVGAALAIWAWSEQQLKRTRAEGEGYLPALKPFESAEKLSRDIEMRLETALQKTEQPPRILITGGSGLSATGAKDLLSQVGLNPALWNRRDTAKGGPFPAMLRFPILIHCVSIQEPTAPFLHERLLEDPSRELSVISDVSCALGLSTNVLPLYDRKTTFESPVRRIKYQSSRPLDLIALDRLSSLLPVESSRDLSAKLVPLLLDLRERSLPAWAEAERTFQEFTAPLRDRKKVNSGA
jgi:saccharopine dehydrogenase (NAD+, L-lysine forming)